MNQTNSNYKQLATRYFQGDILPAEEEMLFKFIKTSSLNEKAFRAWEKDWLKSNISTEDIHTEWIKLQNRQLLRNDTNSPPIFRFPHIGIVAAVIIGFVLLSVTLISLQYYYDNRLSQDSFILETGLGEKTKLLLPDGTTVYLNAASSLRYSSNFNSQNREVVLSGEAYFDVRELPKKNPFKVRTPYYDIVVKGTKFNVSAYHNDKKSLTALLNGAIDIIHKGKHISVKPNELIVLDKSKDIFSKEQVHAEQYKSWTDGRIEYDAISLQELVDRLSRKYDVTIRLEKTVNKNEVFSISLRNEETIEDILLAISKTLPIVFEKRGRDIYIR